MVRSLLLSIFVITFQPATAQNKTASDSTALDVENAKWNIGISFSPDYSYRKIEALYAYNANNAAANKQCADSLNSIEKATVSWTAGIPVSYAFNRFIGVKSGIFLSNKTFQSNGFVHANGVYYSWEIFDKESVEKSHFYFIEIPFSLQYTYRPRKIKNLTFSLFAGFSGCLNSEEHRYQSRAWQTDYSNPSSEESYSKLYVDKFALLYLGYTAGIKLCYKLNETLLIGLEPVYKFYGKEFVDAEANGNAWRPGKLSKQIMGVSEKPYSFGINLSIEITK